MMRLMMEAFMVIAIALVLVMLMKLGGKEPESESNDGSVDGKYEKQRIYKTLNSFGNT